MKKRTQTGLAMVIVIWVLSLLIIMAGSFSLSMRRETVVVSAIRDNAEAMAVAESGLVIAAQMLWLSEESKRWHADGSVYSVPYQDAEIRVRLFSEQGKIDINHADETLLMAMISSTSIDIEKQQALVSAILDWRDHDDLIHIDGAEKMQYEDANLAYQPANAKFQQIDELQMVLGMNAKVFQEIEPLITVFSGQGNVNKSVASKEVLQAISTPDSEDVDDLMQQRLEDSQMMSSSFEASQEDIGGGNQSGSNGNSVYTIISQARLSTAAEATVKVTVKRSSDTRGATPYQVLGYQQIYQGISLFSDEMEQFLVILQDESERRI